MDIKNSNNSVPNVEHGVHHVHLHGPNHEDLGSMEDAKKHGSLPAAEEANEKPNEHNLGAVNTEEKAHHVAYPGLIRKPGAQRRF